MIWSDKLLKFLKSRSFHQKGLALTLVWSLFSLALGAAFHWPMWTLPLICLLPLTIVTVIFVLVAEVNE